MIGIYNLAAIFDLIYPTFMVGATKVLTFANNSWSKSIKVFGYW